MNWRHGGNVYFPIDIGVLHCLLRKRACIQSQACDDSSATILLLSDDSQYASLAFRRELATAVARPESKPWRYMSR